MRIVLLCFDWKRLIIAFGIGREVQRRVFQCIRRITCTHGYGDASQGSAGSASAHEMLFFFTISPDIFKPYTYRVMVNTVRCASRWTSTPECLRGYGLVAKNPLRIKRRCCILFIYLFFLIPSLCCYYDLKRKNRMPVFSHAVRSFSHRPISITMMAQIRVNA